MRFWARILVPVAALALPLAATLDAGAQQRPSAPHEWVWGSWIGGFFPAGEAEGPECFGNATVIFTRDIVMRASSLDTAYRQRVIETVADQPGALEFRFTPASPVLTALGPRVPPDAAFGCQNPNALRVERLGPDEIAFPHCAEFPSPLRRCRMK